VPGFGEGQTTKSEWYVVERDRDPVNATGERADVTGPMFALFAQVRIGQSRARTHVLAS